MFIKNKIDCLEFEAGDKTLLRELIHPNNDLVNFESSGSSTIAFYQINNIKLSGNATANNSIKLGNSSRKKHKIQHQNKS